MLGVRVFAVRITGDLPKLTCRLCTISATIYAAFEMNKLNHAIILSKLAGLPVTIAGASSVHGDVE